MPDSLVALRDRREQVIARISDCFASDVLEVDELERRLDLAHRAATVAELDALVVDLAPVAASTALAVASPGTLAVDDAARPDRKRLRVIMGSIERRGPWTVPRQLDVRVFWGTAELDFRDASLAAGVTTITVSVTMANLEVILPPGLAVDVDVSSFAGSVAERHRVSPAPDPSRPVLRFEGAVRFGSLEVSTRLAGESGRDARKRERREGRARRKALRAGGDM